MSAPAPPDPASQGTASLAVQGRAPYEVIAYSFSEGYQDSPTDLGLPKAIVLALIRPEDELWIRNSEQEQIELYCLLDPAEPESQIAGFTFTARVSGFRNLRGRGLAVELTSTGPVTTHLVRGK